MLNSTWRKFLALLMVDVFILLKEHALGNVKTNGNVMPP